MANTFSYDPTVSSQLKQSPRVKKIQFGNGYFQITGDGINSNMETWNLGFIVGDTAKQAIEDFFIAEGGYTYFNWTAPMNGATQKQYICPQWNITPLANNNYNISALFTEFPGLT